MTLPFHKLLATQLTRRQRTEICASDELTELRRQRDRVRAEEALAWQNVVDSSTNREVNTAWHLLEDARHAAEIAYLLRYAEMVVEATMP